MYKVLKTQLKVNQSDRDLIDKMILERHRAWNKLVEEFNPRYNERKYPSMTEFNHFVKKVSPTLPANARIAVWMDFRNAWTATFRIKNRRQPRFHRIDRANSVKCNTNNGLSVKDNKFHLTRYNKIELCETFPDKPSGWLANFTLSRKNGKYFVTFTWKEDIPIEQPKPNQIGLDYGFKDFFTDSNGNRYNLPKSLIRQTQRIKSLQRVLSGKDYTSKKVQSNNWKRVRNKLGRAWEKYANIKKDFIEKLTTTLCRENDLVALETLNLKWMEKSNYRPGRRRMNENCFGRFRTRLIQKSVRYTTKVIEISKVYPSSQLCSTCGVRHREMKDLAMRELNCECGTILDRDHNAAINILNQAKSSLKCTG